MNNQVNLVRAEDIIETNNPVKQVKNIMLEQLIKLQKLNMDDPEKQETELKSLRAVKDSFKKIVISKSYGKSWVDEEGILRINMIDFLLDADSLKRC